MKRMLALVLTAVMLLGLLAGCGEEKQTSSEAAGTESGKAEATGAANENGKTEATGAANENGSEEQPSVAENPIRAYRPFINSATYEATITTFDGKYYTIPECGDALVLPDRQHLVYSIFQDTSNREPIGDRTVYVADLNDIENPREIYSGHVYGIRPLEGYVEIQGEELVDYALDYDTLEFHPATEGDRLEPSDGSGIVKRHFLDFYIEQRPDEDGLMYPHYYLVTKDHGNIPLDDYVSKVYEAFSVYDPEGDEYFFSLSGLDDLTSICYRCKDGQITELVRGQEGNKGTFVPKISNGVLSILFAGTGETTTLLRPKGSTEFVTVNNTAELNESVFRYGTDQGLYVLCRMESQEIGKQSLCFMGNDGSFTVMTEVDRSTSGHSVEILADNKVMYYNTDGALCTAILDGPELKDPHVLMPLEDQYSFDQGPDPFVTYVEKADALVVKGTTDCYLMAFNGEGKYSLGDSSMFRDLDTTADGEYYFAVIGRARQLMQWKTEDLAEAARTSSTEAPDALGTEIDRNVVHFTVTSGRKYLDPDEMLYMASPSSGIEKWFKLKKGSDITVIVEYDH